MTKVKVEATFNGWVFGMREYCGNCMEEIDGDIFCPHCGERFETNKDRVITFLELDTNISAKECADIITKNNYEFCGKRNTCEDCILHLKSSSPKEFCLKSKSTDEIKKWLEDYVIELK